MNENASDYLILNLDNFQENLKQFFKSMDKSITHRKLLTKDPVGVIQKMVFPDKDFSGYQIGGANLLLFSILSNRKFMAWAEKYQKKIEDEALKITSLQDKDEAIKLMTTLFDKHKLYTDVLDGILENGDVEILRRHVKIS